MLGRENHGEIFNISFGKEISIDELINKISSITKITKEIKQSNIRVRPIKSEVNRLLGDSNKFRTLTNWSPLINLEEGLSNTIEWIKNSEKNLKNSSYYIV